MPAPSPTDGRTISGTAFAVAAIAAAALFVVLLIVVSPVLSDWTLERVPPSAPHTVAETASWEAVATQADEDTGCVELRTAGQTSGACTSVRGAPLRTLGALPLRDGPLVVYGIVDARTVVVVLELTGGESRRMQVVHVDFGFPLGFFATEVVADAGVERIVAVDRDGLARAEAVCDAGAPTAERCPITDLR